ncbi:sugar kinase [Pseudorhodobacter sp. MZDSW-24AT]|uniref:sugar kinase n=1 Tax=Pseudorhodobacter sp. MZDSW-24AT TaxID=2052957 RepID=UPI000C1F8B73|nr:sugar kinase [Pseudorhodobacter sp. MZDSW-24AT]PJF07939.1 2-dehydro-3-deoxygluconokinase [Pseudorhodobacter sp. MZDSW-24AT]
MSKSLLCLGECMVELSPTATGDYARGFAGDTFNTAWYARRLLPADWSVAYGSCIGTDAISEEMAAFMAGEGIDTTPLRRLPDRTVGLYMISLRKGERSFSYWRGQSAAKALADDPVWLASILRGRSVIHFSAITLAILGPDQRHAFCAALAQARAEGSLIAFDTNLRPRLWEGPEAMRAGVLLGASVADIVLPSFDEETGLWGDQSPAETIARYQKAGAARVVVKDGGGPVTLWSAAHGSRQHAATPVAQIVDTTAAGDSFAGTFLAHLAQGATEDEAAQKAMALAARVIQSRGALVPSLFA